MTVYNWLSLLGVPGMLAALGSFIWMQIKQNKAMRNGLKAILRDSLLRAYYACHGQGYATSDERDNFEEMYIQYHSLGGNGVMEDVRQRFLALPLR